MLELSQRMQFINDTHQFLVFFIKITEPEFNPHQSTTQSKPGPLVSSYALARPSQDALG